MDYDNDFYKVTKTLINQKKFGEAINYLQKILKTGTNKKEVSILLEQIKKIAEYQNKDIFSSTNLDMDPWLE
jgi:uncharacterized Zn finger protein